MVPNFREISEHGWVKTFLIIMLTFLPSNLLGIFIKIYCSFHKLPFPVYYLLSQKFLQGGTVVTPCLALAPMADAGTNVNPSDDLRNTGRILNS